MSTTFEAQHRRQAAGRFAVVRRDEPQLALFDAEPGDSAPVLHVMGFNDEQTTCDRCGKVELRGTVVLADDDGNEVARMGTTCASKAVGAPVDRGRARLSEAARRAEVSSDLRGAAAALDAGHLADAVMYVRDARRRGLHRPAELVEAARVDDEVLRRRQAQPERWGYQLPGRQACELDSRADADLVVARYARMGAVLVRLTDGGWSEAA